MNKEVEEALMHIEVIKGVYEPIKKHSYMGYPLVYENLHKTLIEEMSILDKNNYEYSEEEKKLLDELKSTFFGNCSEEYKRDYNSENNKGFSL